MLNFSLKYNGDTILIYGIQYLTTLNISSSYDTFVETIKWFSFCSSICLFGSVSFLKKYSFAVLLISNTTSISSCVNQFVSFWEILSRNSFFGVNTFDSLLQENCFILEKVKLFSCSFSSANKYQTPWLFINLYGFTTLCFSL